MRIGDYVEYKGARYYICHIHSAYIINICTSLKVYTSIPTSECVVIAQTKLHIGESSICINGNYLRFIGVGTNGLRFMSNSEEVWIPFSKIKNFELYTPIKQGESEMFREVNCSCCNEEPETPLDTKALELAKQQAIDNALAEKKKQYEAAIEEYIELENKRIEITERCKAIEKLLKITPAFKKRMF